MNAPSTRPLRCGLYCRVSSTGQGDNHSLPSQEDACRAYAEERGWQVVRVEREVGSGSDLFGRPKLSTLRTSVRHGEVDVLLAYALDRLSRDQNHLGLILTEAERAGAHVELVTEDVDDTPLGKMTRAIMAGVAEIERLKIRERTGRGKRERVASGKRLAAPRAKYGYAWVDEVDDKGRPLRDRLQINPVTAPVVQRIYGEYAAGVALRHVADALTRDGIPTPSQRAGEPARPWQARTVHYLLQEPDYMGVSAANRKRVELVQRPDRDRKVRICRERPGAEQVPLPPTPALVDVATWEAVQARLAVNRVRSERSAEPRRDCLLRGGFVECGHCRARMHVDRSKAQSVYRCRGERRDPACGRSGHTISVAAVEAAVRDLVPHVLTDWDRLALELARQDAADDNGAAALEALDRALRDVAKQEANLTDALSRMTNPAAIAGLAARLDALGEQRQRLQGERTEVLGQRTARQATLANAAAAVDALFGEVEAAGGWERVSYDGLRALIERLGLRVRVYREGSGPDRFVVVVPVGGPPCKSLPLPQLPVTAVAAQVGTATWQARQGKTEFTTTSGFSARAVMTTARKPTPGGGPTSSKSAPPSMLRP